jgi:putative PIN family toxin of toxin-antitoxin system
MQGESVKKKKIVIDTNLLISYIIRGGNSPLSTVIKNENHIILASSELIEEYISVLKRPKFQRYFDIVNVDDIMNGFIKLLTLVQVDSTVKLCRDPNDDFIIQLAISGNSDFLITGDKDILALERIGNCRFITISEFILLDFRASNNF